jgi:hypothetical protein
MEFKVPFTKKPSEQIKGFVQITLTPEGIRESEDFNGQGDKFEILAALLQKRPNSIGNVAKLANISFGNCLKACKELKNEGLIQQVSRPQ